MTGSTPDALNAHEQSIEPIEETASFCPMAKETGSDAWLVLGHPEVVSAATDPETFSSTVSTRRVIPNGLDGEEHATYRAVVDRYMTLERVAALEPTARAVAAEIVAGLPRDVTVKTITHIGTPFAVRSMSAWLGWPRDLEDELVTWMRDNLDATRSGDRSRTAEVAERFDRMIRSLLDDRRDRPVTDVTGELMDEQVDGRPLTEEETVSILRNWTAGDLGSLASSVGVIVHFLASRPEVQAELRTHVTNRDVDAQEAAVEEILRIDDPFLANRRRTTTQVDLGDERLEEGTLLRLNWATANRDPRVFPFPDHYDPVGHAPDNLVFGIGPHICPGRALTLMELRVVIAELLAHTDEIVHATDRQAEREQPPGGGWARVPVVLVGQGDRSGQNGQ